MSKDHVSKKRTPTKRLFAVSIGAFCLSCGVGGVYALRHRQVSAHYASLRREGLSALQSGDDTTALKDLSLYLGRYPQDPAALAGFARASLNAGNADGQSETNAVAALRSVVKEDPSRKDDGRLLLSLYLRAGYFNEALDSANALLAQSPNDAGILGDKVEALIGLQQFDEAQRFARQWTQLAPDDMDAQMSVLTIMQQQHQPAADISAAGDALLKHHPKDLHFLFLRGYARSLAGDPSAAEDFKAVASAVPVDDDHLVQVLVAELDRQGLLDQSLGVLVRAYAVQKSPQALGRLARRYFDAGQLQQMTDLLAKAPAEQVSATNQLVALQALALIQLNRASDAGPSLELLRSRSNDPVAAAWTVVLNQLASKDATSDPKRVVDACTAALKRAPDAPYLSFFLADAYAQSGNNELAITHWERSAAREKAWALPLIRASELLAQEGRNESALAAANEAVRRSPHSTAAIIMLARVWATCVDQGQYGKSDELLNLVTQIQTQLPYEEQTLPIQIELLAKAGKVDQAKKVLDAALGGSTRLSEATLLRLAAVSDDLKLDLRDQLLQRIQQHTGMTPSLAYAQAMSLNTAGKPDEGLKLIQNARAKADPSGASLDWRISETRYVDQIKSPHALDQLIALGNAYPNDGRVQRMILASTGGWTNREFMDQTINRFRTITGERGAQWRVARGRWLLDFSTTPTDTQDAINILTAATRLAPDLTDAHVLLARAQERAGKLDAAIDQLNAASSLDPNSDSISLYTVKLLQAQGNFEAARERLERVVANPLHDTQQRQQAAILLAREGEVQQAIDLLRDGTGQQADQNHAYLLLAELYRERHEPEKAAELCDQLMQHPDATVVQFTADLLASQGQLAQAQEILKRLDTLSLDPGMPELIRADFAARHLSPPEALAGYQAAVGAAPKNVKTWNALVDWQLAAGDLPGARRSVDAAIDQLPEDANLQSLRAHWDLLQGVELLPQLRPIGVTFAHDPREGTAACEILRAASAAQQSGQSASRLIEPLSAVGRKYPQDSSVQMLIAEICLESGKNDDAIAAAHQANQLAPASPEPFQLLYRANAQANRWSEALDAATQWKDHATGDLTAADVAIATCQLGLKDPSSALSQLQPYAADPKAPAYLAVLPTYARAEQMLQKSDAMQLMEPVLKQGAPGRRQWIDFAAHNVSVTERPAWLDRVAPLIPSDSADEQLQLAEAWLQSATQTHSASDSDKARVLLEKLTAQPQPKPEALLMLGMLQEQMKDPVAAEASYRKVLALQPGSVVAENNLAMILCRRGQNLDEAAALSSSALRSHADIPALYDTAAAVQAAQKHYTDAVSNLESAVQMQPANIAYRVRLAVYLADAGRMQRAGEIVKELDDQHMELTKLGPEDQQQLDTLRKLLASRDPNGAEKGTRALQPS